MTDLDVEPVGAVLVDGADVVIDSPDLGLDLEPPLGEVSVDPAAASYDVVPVAGPAGPPNRVTVTAGEPMARLHVAVVRVDGRAYLADVDPVTAVDVGEHVVGVVASSVLPGEQVDLVQVGDLLADTLPLGPLYLGPGGSLTTDPEAGAFMLAVGLSVAGRLIVNIQRPIHRA